MHSNVGSDVIPLDSCSVTGTPLTSEIKIVSALAADVTFTDVFLYVVR